MGPDRKIEMKKRIGETEMSEEQNLEQQEAGETDGGRDLYEWVQALVCSVLAVVMVFTFAVRLIGQPTVAEGAEGLKLVTVIGQSLCLAYGRCDKTE